MKIVQSSVLFVATVILSIVATSPAFGASEFRSDLPLPAHFDTSWTVFGEAYPKEATELSDCINSLPNYDTKAEHAAGERRLLAETQTFLDVSGFVASLPASPERSRLETLRARYAAYTAMHCTQAKSDVKFLQKGFPDSYDAQEILMGMYAASEKFWRWMDGYNAEKSGKKKN